MRDSTHVRFRLSDQFQPAAKGFRGGAVVLHAFLCVPDESELRAAIEKEMLGEIRLRPATDGGLWAEYCMSPGILLMGAGSGGRGEALHAVPVITVRIRVK